MSVIDGFKSLNDFYEEIGLAEWISIPDVAAMLGVDVTTVRRWVYDGIVPKEEVKVFDEPDPETKCRYFISLRWFDNALQKANKKVTAKKVKDYFTPFGGPEVENCHSLNATLSAKEAADELGVNYNTIIKWVKDGLLVRCTINGKPVGMRFARHTIRGLAIWKGANILRRKEIKQSQNKHAI